MKYWEFLIQKEGDETWLPLETQQVEILEGRYRVVAHTDRVNTPMEIRVSQLMTQEMPPRKRVRKRLGQTNDTGLVVVMPYVHLKPGQWELTCRSIPNDPNPSPTWQYQVQLQVFAPTEEDWSNEWPVPADATTAGASAIHSTLVEAPEGDALASRPEDMPLVQAQAELKSRLDAQPAVNGEAAIAESTYRISLKQQAFLARRNQAMTIMGQVQALSESSTFEGVSQLWLRLQNPETAQVIMEAHRPLSVDRLPADFKVKIQLPTNVKTRVVLGEVSLRTASVDAHTPARILSSTAFTITAGIAQLIDEIASRDPGQFEEEVSELADSQAHALYQSGMPANTQSGYVEPDLVSPILNPTHKPVVPAVGVVLPPKLDPRLDANEAHEQAFEAGAYSGNYTGEQPQLPSFGNGAPPLQVSDGSAPVQASELSADKLSSHDSAEPAEPAEPADVDRPLPEETPDETPDEMTVNALETTSVDQPSATAQPTPAVLSDLPPMVSQPAQFMSSSIEEDDIEASQIAALLEDIDGNLGSQTIGMDELEPPGVEAALPDSFADDADYAADYATEPTSRSDDDTEPLLPFPGASASDLAASNSPPASFPSAPQGHASRGASQSSAAEPSSEPAAPAEQFLTRAERERQQRAQRQAEANTAFKSLKLKKHFWQRLSNLTHESRKEAAQLSKEMKAAGVDPRSRTSFGVEDATSAPSPRSGDLVPSDSLPANSEVVIYDRSLAPQNSAASSSVSASAASATNRTPASSQAEPRAYTTDLTPAPTPTSGVPVPPSIAAGGMDTQPGTASGYASPEEDLPDMALPVISVPAGDLVAGSSVTVTVRSQPSVYKPFIKLWMVDRQSRTLVGEPKLLTNLQPDALGYLEASTELRVPMGCLDVQIAAIAVDMATQQESNKAIVNRHVVPADQSSGSLRNFKF